jgi:hypothetical protein
MGLAVIGVSGVWPWMRTQANEALPELSEDDPTAQQLKYVHDASSVPDDMRGINDYCYNCRYFKGDQDTSWAACDLFPGKAVAANGWCSVWSAMS